MKYGSGKDEKKKEEQYFMQIIAEKQKSEMNIKLNL